LEKVKVTIEAVRQIGLIEKVRKITTEARRHGGTQREIATKTQRHEEAQRGTVRKMVRYSLAVAAVIVVFFAVRSFNSGTSTDALYQQAYVDYQLSGVRGNDTLTLAERLYQQGKYDEVIDLQLRNKSMNQVDRLLTGLSYLKTNHPKEAIEWFNSVSITGPYRQDAEFYLALAYLKNNNTKTAASLMQKIHNDTGHIYRNQFPEDYIKKVEEK